jgi:hypothetical protein
MNKKILSLKSGLRALMGVAVVAVVLFASCSGASSGGDPADPVDPVKSAVCTLSALTVSEGTLTPAFDPAVTAYTVDVESSVKSITVTGTAVDAKATVSESAAAARTLALGSTTIVLTVTAENGTAKAYTVTAFRKPVVYAAGYYYDGTSYPPCYWKGTTKIDLPLPAGASAQQSTGIALDGGSVYVSGFFDSGSGYVACYWKDGVRTDLSSGGYSALALDITVVNGTVYLAGYYKPTATDERPCYWSAGTLVEMGLSGDTYGRAYAISVAGSDVYTAGMTMTSSETHPCYWKGTEKTVLPHSSASYNQGRAEDIAIINGVVHVVAWYTASGTNQTGVFWNNDVATYYTVSGAQITLFISLADNNGNVSYAGIYRMSGGNYKPFILNGSVLTDLPVDGTDCSVDALAMLDGRSYVAGYNTTATDDDTSLACYWEGTTCVSLSSVQSGVTGIALGE